MLTKSKDVRRLDPEEGVNKLFENGLCKWRIQNIFQGGGRGTHFDIFSGRVTSGQIEKQKQLQGGRGECYPKNFLKILAAEIAILVLFVQFSRKILYKFFTPNFEPLTKMMQ